MVKFKCRKCKSENLSAHHYDPDYFMWLMECNDCGDISQADFNQFYIDRMQEIERKESA